MKGDGCGAKRVRRGAGCGREQGVAEGQGVEERKGQGVEGEGYVWDVKCRSVGARRGTGVVFDAE